MEMIEQWAMVLTVAGALALLGGGIGYLGGKLVGLSVARRERELRAVVDALPACGTRATEDLHGTGRLVGC